MNFNKQNTTKIVLDIIAKYPYLVSIITCICINYLSFCDTKYIPNYIFIIEAFLVLFLMIGICIQTYKETKIKKHNLFIYIIILFSLIIKTISMFYNSSNKSIWYCSFAFIILLLLYSQSDLTNHRIKLNVLLIVGTGFLLSSYYVFGINIVTHQHDVFTFDSGKGHAGYIKHLLVNHKLPNFDVRTKWQFYHPPLHHAICAIWLFFNENILNINSTKAKEGLQILTLFYSMCVIISSYRIFKIFNIKNELAIYLSMTIISFSPTFIYFSASINNDVLSVVFFLKIIEYTLQWISFQSFCNILKIFLFFLLGMSTKISTFIIIPSILLIFFYVYYKQMKIKKIFQIILFLLIIIPLSFWYNLRNQIYWQVPIFYVQELPIDDQYINKNFINRITDFSFYQFKKVYLQWAWRNEYNEFNPTIALLKTSIFGEFIDERNFENFPLIEKYLTKYFFWINCLLILMMLITFIYLSYNNINIKLEYRIFFTSLILCMLASYYYMTYKYPFVCTMNFRYVTPLLVIGSLYIGKLIDFLHSKNNFKYLKTIISFIIISYAICSTIMILIIGGPEGI